MQFNVAKEDETITLANQLAQVLLPLKPFAATIALSGDLGAGKTTFARALLQALGVTEKIKSPTYTLVESYQLTCGKVDHFDWYRLHTPQEVLELGIEEMLGHDIVLVEWPEQVPALHEHFDLIITLTQPEALLAGERHFKISAQTTLGQTILLQLKRVHDAKTVF